MYQLCPTLCPHPATSFGLIGISALHAGSKIKLNPFGNFFKPSCSNSILGLSS
jgi:hypothetical protein